MKDFLRKNKYLCILLLTFVLFYIIPYSVMTFTGGSDFKFHFNRIYSISENIRHGKFFFPIYHTTLFNYGYASPLFYGDLFLYPFALLLAAGLKETTVSRLVLYAIVAASIFSSYFAGKKIFRSDRSAFLLTFLYVFSSYYSLNITYRYDLGEAFAMIFIPLVTLGFYSIVYKDKKYWLWLPFGLAGVILSHTLTAVVTVVFLFLAALCSFKALLEDKKKILYILVSALIFTGLSATFVFPLIEQLNSATFLSTSGQSATYFGTLAERAMPTSFLFSDLTMILEKTNGSFQWVPNGTGLFPILTFIYGLVILKTKEKPFYYLFTAGLITLLATSRRFPWDLFQNIFGIIQFPWRLLMFAILFFALAAALLVNREHKFDRYFIIAACILSSVSFWLTAEYKYREMYDATKTGFVYSFDYYSRIGSGEYMPACKDADGDYIDYQVLTKMIEDRGETISSNNLKNSDMSFLRNYGDITVTYKNNSKDDTFIEVPLLMYKGYKAIDSNGDQLKISYGDINTVRVFVNGSAGEFTVKYTRTPVQLISAIISTGTLIIALYYVLKKKDVIR